MTVGKFTIISNHNCSLHDHTTTLAWATTADLCHLNIHFILSSSIFSRLQTAHNTSSSSVRVSWKAPPLSTIHGEFLGYRITYRPRDKQQSEDTKEIYIRDSSVEVCDIINLNYESAERRRACASTGHNCHHCVAARTMAALAGSGEVDKMFNMQRLRQGENIHAVHYILLSNTTQSHEVNNLETFTQYLVSVQVFNPEGLGPSSTVLIMTDEGGECCFQLWKIYFLSVHDIFIDREIESHASLAPRFLHFNSLTHTKHFSPIHPASSTRPT